MEKKSKKTIIIGMTGLFLVMFLLLGLTYAYYRTRIIGNESTDPSISVQSKKLEITYIDGTSKVNMEGLIEPGFEYEKTFKVKNTGDGKVDYGVYLEEILNEFSRTNDMNLTLTCKSDVTDKTCNGTTQKYPKIDALLVTNTLEAGETQEYTMTVVYTDLTTEDQSIDMGKNLSGKVQIYDLTNTLKENTLAYKLISNAKNEIGSTVYRSEPLSIPAQETTTIQSSIEGSSGTENLIGMSYYTYAANVEFNELSGYSLVNPQVDTWDNIKTNPIKLANFKYLRRESGVSSIPNERTQTIKDMVKVESTDNNILTYTMLELESTGRSIEKTLSATRDDYGISFYYRGDVEDNFVEYNGMCWRVMRIQGDGSIKLLHESSNKCGETILSTGLEGFYGEDDNGLPNYSDSTYNPTLTMKKVLSDWLVNTNINTNDLKRENWCLGNIKDAYRFSAPYEKLEGQTPQTLITSNSSFSYETYNRLYRRYPEQTHLDCGENSLTYSDYIGAITADEAMFAGDKIGWITDTAFLFNGNPHYFSTMSIMYYENVSNRKNTVLVVSPDRNIGPVSTISRYSLKPSIVLKENIKYVSGTGTIDNPYIIGNI